MKSSKKMTDLFKILSQKESIAVVFNDFVKLSAIAISNSIDDTRFRERELEYLGISAKYSKEELVVFPQLLAALGLELETDMRDVLGEIYMDLGLGVSGMGQFFTPWHTAYFMAESILTKSDEKVTKVADSCVGSGVMLIAQAAVLRDRGIHYQEKLRVFGSDIDRNILLMCYLQLSLLGIDGIFERKNSMLDEPGEVWYTPLHVINNC